MTGRESCKGPHIRGEESTRTVMTDMLIALTPSLIWGVYAFGLRALLIVVLSVSCFALAEWAMAKIEKKRSGLSDLSTVVGGAIFAMALPVGVPLWIVPLGAILAVVLFGHLLHFVTRYFLNSVLGALSLLFLLFPGAMTRLVQPFVYLPAFSVTPAIPEGGEVKEGVLSLLKSGVIPEDLNVSRLLAGVTAGGIGSVSGLLLLTGGLYLLVRRVISWQIPLCFFGSAALLFLLFPRVPEARVEFVLAELAAGGLILAVIFFANDPLSSPVTRTGKAIFGLLCGLLTFLFRMKLPLAEGVGFAVMIASLFTRGLDVLFRPRVYGKKRDLWRILSSLPQRISDLLTRFSSAK